MDVHFIYIILISLSLALGIYGGRRTAGGKSGPDRFPDEPDGCDLGRP